MNKKKVAFVTLGAFGAIVATTLVVAALQPPTFHIERKTEIAREPSTVYAALEDFHRFGEWSPWEKLDPNLKRTYTGPQKGLGASYGWVGNDDVGEGRMTIVEAVPNEKVVVKLEFIKPFATTNMTTWTLKPEGGKTVVTWAMDGKNEGLIAKCFSMFMDIDKMVGKDFENGLSSLKKVAEESPKAEPAKAP